MATVINPSRRARAALRRQGLSLPRRPEYDTPRLPSDITDIDDPELMELMVKFQEYENHIAGLLTSFEIDEQEADAELELAKARHLVKTWTGTSSDRVAVQKAEALDDPNVQEIAARHRSLKNQRKLYSVMVSTMAAGSAVCSRELTRRSSDGRKNHR